MEHCNHVDDGCSYGYGNLDDGRTDHCTAAARRIGDDYIVVAPPNNKHPQSGNRQSFHVQGRMAPTMLWPHT